MNEKVIYFDNASATKTDDRVVDEMLPFIKEYYANPSALHTQGSFIKEKIEKARDQVADLVNCQSNEVFFTSSATESNNFALWGIARVLKEKGNHIVSSSIEHLSILNPLKDLKKDGFDFTLVPVDKEGHINPMDIEKAIKENTILISIMHANNEIGTIQEIKKISEIAAQRKIMLHTDAAATAGIIETDVNKLGVDLMSFSSQQMYGPKGIAALYIKKGTRIRPLLQGGIQEGGRRAGTENVCGIIGFGKACEIAKAEMSANAKKLIKLRDYMISGIKSTIKDVKLNGDPHNRMPGNVHFSFEFIEGESILLMLDFQKIAAASGSSCASAALKSSHCLSAIGLEATTAQGSILFSLGKYNTKEEVDYLLKELPPIIDRLRQMSPIYKGDS